MSMPLEIGPLTIEIQNTVVRIYFSDPLAPSMEIPPSFEAQMLDVVNQHRELLQDRQYWFDLGNMPAISSRQLGMILTVREVMKSMGPVVLKNISSSVRQLLRLTSTERFFPNSE